MKSNSSELDYGLSSSKQREDRHKMIVRRLYRRLLDSAPAAIKKALMGSSHNPIKVLNPDKMGEGADRIVKAMATRIVGQDHVRSILGRYYQVAHTGYTSIERPIGVVLFLGPMGSGITSSIEVFVEAVFGSPHKVNIVDCSEFQHASDIAKLVGSPPGYVGHRKTAPRLRQEALYRAGTLSEPWNVLVFERIELAHSSLLQLFLGVFDKARLRMANGEVVDFSRTLIILTSSVGAKEIAELHSPRIGFRPRALDLGSDSFVSEAERVAREAMRRKLSPELMNRIDEVVVFRQLQEFHFADILDLALATVNQRIKDAVYPAFKVKLTSEARGFLLRKGVNLRYGARHLNRIIERWLVAPIAAFIDSGQVWAGDELTVSCSADGAKLEFRSRLSDPKFVLRRRSLITGRTSLNKKPPKEEEDDDDTGAEQRRQMHRTMAMALGARVDYGERNDE